MKKNTLLLFTLIIVLHVFFGCENSAQDGKDNSSNNDDEAYIQEIFPKSGSNDNSCRTVITLTFLDELDSTKPGTVTVGTLTYVDGSNAELSIKGNKVDIVPHVSFLPATTYQTLCVSGFRKKDKDELPPFRDEQYNFSTTSDPEQGTSGTDVFHCILFSEFKPANTNGAGNEYIELFNPSGESLKLDSLSEKNDFALYRFTNGASDRTQWQLLFSFNGSDLSIDAGGYLLLGSGDYAAISKATYKAELSGNSGGLALVRGSRSKGDIVDIVCYDNNDSWNNTVFCDWELTGSADICESCSFTRDIIAVETHCAENWRIDKTPSPGEASKQ